MNLTTEEEAMLSGRHGQGVRIAAEVMTALGESQDAARFVPIRRAHAICTLDSLACDPKLEIQGGLLFLEELVNGGARSREEVTLTLQPPGIDVQKPGAGGAPEAYATLQLKILETLIRLGATPAYSCLAYLDANVPNFNEVVAYGESSVAVYANSILGARTNRESGPTPLCAAILGRVPEYGLLLDEHRRGQVLVQVTAALTNPIDYALLGAYLGQALVDEVPVLTGIPATVSPEDLKYLGSCASVTGAISMFHMAGITPEAQTVELAFGGRPPPAEISVTDADLAAVLDSVRTFDGPFDMVMLGNPQYTVRELARLAGWLEGRKISENVELLVCTNSFQRTLADRMGYVASIKASGAEILDICGCGVRETRLGRHAVRAAQRVVTDGVKSALYLRDGGNVDVAVAPAQECVEAAVRGTWHG